MITPQEKKDIDEALDKIEEAIKRHNQWLEEQINKLQAKRENDESIRRHKKLFSACLAILDNQEAKQDALPLEHIREYDAAAEYCAKNDKLPANMGSPGAIDWIKSDPEAFEDRVRQFKYALAHKLGEIKP